MIKPNNILKKHKMFHFMGKKVGCDTIIASNSEAVAVTIVKVLDNAVLSRVIQEDFNYFSLGFDAKSKKNVNKAQLPQFKLFDNAFRVVKGFWIASDYIKDNEIISSLKEGDTLTNSLLSVNENIQIRGTSKGRGFTGVMKRWGFHGGPASHGASLFHRKGGSIGQEKDPGKVFKNKKMAGRSGGAIIFLPSCVVFDIRDNLLYIKGAIPGPKGSLVTLSKKLQCLN